VLRTVEQQFGSAPTPSDSSAEAREKELLQQINEGPSELIWQRYHQLAAKRDAEMLTAAEHDELVALSETIEAADVQRLGHMAELAKLRGTKLSAVRDQLGIRNPASNDGLANG
jgi:hypothetical protein